MVRGMATASKEVHFVLDSCSQFKFTNSCVGLTLGGVLQLSPGLAEPTPFRPRCGTHLGRARAFALFDPRQRGLEQQGLLRLVTEPASYHAGTRIQVSGHPRLGVRCSYSRSRALRGSPSSGEERMSVRRALSEPHEHVGCLCTFLSLFGIILNIRGYMPVPCCPDWPLKPQHRILPLSLAPKEALFG